MKLAAAQLAFIESCRRAVLATIRGDGGPRLVPVCFAVIASAARDTLYSPLDEKPKSSDDVRSLGRVRDVLVRPDVALLFDRWDEDWAELAWLRIDGRARLVEPGEPEHAAALHALRRRYDQYRSQSLEGRPLIAVDPGRVAAWAAGAQPPFDTRRDPV